MTEIVIAVVVSCAVSALVIKVMAKKCIRAMDKYAEDVTTMMEKAFDDVISMLSKRK